MKKQLMKQVNKNILQQESCWYIELTNGGVKSMETRVTEIEIGLYLAHNITVMG